MGLAEVGQGLLSAVVAEAHHTGHTRPNGSGQAGGGILKGTHLAGVQTQLGNSTLVGLRMRFFAAHIGATHPEAKAIDPIRQQLGHQGADSRSATGGDNRLGQARGRHLLHQGEHTWPQGQTAIANKGAVMELFVGLQGRHPLGIRRHPLALLECRRNPLRTAGDRQQRAVGLGIPMDGQTGLSKGPVEGQPVTIPLSFGKRAIHIPQNGS